MISKRTYSALFAQTLLWLSLLILPMLVTACSGLPGSNQALLSEVTPDVGTLDLNNGVNVDGAINLNYTIGKNSTVSALLQGPNGQTTPLRENTARIPGSYSLRLDGSIDTVENGLTQTRLLANGDYRYTIQAKAESGETSEASGHFKVINSPNIAGAPGVEALSASPATISPNFDARDDTSIIGWRTTQPATVTVSIAGPNDFSKILTTIKNQPAHEDRTVFNGLDTKGDPLPDGVYTYTVQAADRWGNVSRSSSTLEVKGGGRPQALIEQASIGPTEIISGNLITVTVRVRNVGKVPIRTQGPDPGYVYNMGDVFSSIEGGKYKDQAGFWRIGVDYQSNSGGGPSRYPFRWGFGHDLQPGEEAEVTGSIRVDRNENKFQFYIGLIQEQIALPQDRIQITDVKVSY
ncbi:MAG TPA: hypothetical protein VH186_00935 [Chloroflexia bacterium]|nr:hypothetical protein [Chloroflexia bacterium]